MKNYTNNIKTTDGTNNSGNRDNNIDSNFNNNGNNYANNSNKGNTNLNNSDIDINSTNNNIFNRSNNISNSIHKDDGDFNEPKKVTFGHTTIHNTLFKSLKDTTTLSKKCFDDVSDEYSITKEDQESEESSDIKESIKFLDEVFKKNEEDYFNYPGSVED